MISCLTHYLEVNNILDSSHLGFRAGYSMDTTLLYVLEGLRTSMDEGRSVALILEIFLWP